MNRFRTRLSLQSLDDRIVPDGTPVTLVDPPPADPTPSQQTNAVAIDDDGCSEADNAAKIAELEAQIAANNATIAATAVELAQLDCLIADAKQRAADLSAARPGLVAAVTAANAEVKRLTDLGQVDGPDYDKALKAVTDAEAAVVSNFQAQLAANDAAKELARQKEEILLANSKLETENTEPRRQIDQLKATCCGDHETGGVQ